MISRFKKILSRSPFGKRLVTKEEYQELQNGLVKQANLVAENTELRKQIKLLAQTIEDLKEEIKITKSVYGFEVDPFLGDPSPVDNEKRKVYVAQVAGLYKDVLEPKFKSMISKAHSMLEEADNDREYDQAIKGCIYSLKEIMRWGESMVNEQLTYQTGDNPSLPDLGVNSNNEQAHEN